MGTAIFEMPFLIERNGEEIETIITFEIQPEEKQNRNHPGAPAQVEIISSQLTLTKEEEEEARTEAMENDVWWGS